jgi:hypothetical protein
VTVAVAELLHPPAVMVIVNTVDWGELRLLLVRLPVTGIPDPLKGIPLKFALLVRVQL